MQAWIVDAFADDRYAGNPAAVIVQEDFPAAGAMQSIAFRLGVPTTAFLVPGSAPHYSIRWFTPQKELNLCGHATIASACYLYDIAGIDSQSELCFETRSGPLFTRRHDGQIAVDLPRMDAVPCQPVAGLEEALGAKIVHCARAIDDILVELESESAVARLQPRFEALAAIDCRGHIVTARASEERADFVSRSFFPALGVDEDQVCVSAHCKLAPYWARKLGRLTLSAVQLSPRGGRLAVEVVGDRVRVSGTAIVRESLRVFATPA